MNMAINKLKALKRKFAKGGPVQAMTSQMRKLIGQHHAAIEMEDHDQATRIGRQLDTLKPGMSKKSLEMLNSGKTSEDFGRKIKLSTFAEGGKVGAIAGLRRMMSKYGEPKGAGNGGGRKGGVNDVKQPRRMPLYTDMYGQSYTSPDELRLGIENAISEESDEPRWEDAKRMAAALKNEAAVHALNQYEQAFNNAAVDDLAPFQQALAAALESGLPAPVQKGKGGAIKESLSKLRKAAEMSDQELDSAISELHGHGGEMHPGVPGGIDRRGNVYDPSPDPQSPRRRYQDLLDEKIRRKGTAVKTPALAKGGPIKRLKAIGGGR